MSTIKVAARRAGALYFLALVVGLVSLYGFPRFIVSGDAAATARNIMASELAYRTSIMADFAALLMFIFVVVSLYNLLKGVNAWCAMLMVLLVSLGAGVGFVNLLNKIAPLILLGVPDFAAVFTKPQLDALALGFLTLNSNGNTIAGAFWGLWLIPFGILVIKSRFFPRVLGALVLVAGFALVTHSVTSIVFPAYEHVVSQVTLPLSVGELPIIFWLLLKGADAPQPRTGSST